MKKIILFLIILIAGLYIGIGRIDPGICNGPYRQRALHISIIKPIFSGQWDLWLAFGNKHWDYKEEVYQSKTRECRVKGTNDIFGTDYKVGQKFEMECVWFQETRTNHEGCAYWYGNGYGLEGGVIDLTPWSRIVKDNAGIKN